MELNHRRGPGAARWLVLLVTVVASAPGCAGARPAAVDGAAAALEPRLAGPWVITLQQREGPEFALRMTLHADADGRWSAHSRPGAAAEFVGGWRALAGRVLRRLPPHAALANITDGTVRMEDGERRVAGRFASPLLGSFHLVGAVEDGRLRGELRREPAGAAAWTLDAVPHPTPGSLRDYRALAHHIEASFRDRYFDPAYGASAEFRSFARELHRRMARAVDDGDAMAAFYAARPRLRTSHVEFIRDPVMAALPLDSLLLRPRTDPVAFLSFPAPGVALLRVTRWADATAEVRRAFERIDSAGSHTLLLDIRGNAGGDVTSMAPAAHLLRDSTMVGVFLGRRWYAQRRTPPTPAELATLPVFADTTALSLIREVADQGFVVGVVPPVAPHFAGDVYLLVNRRSASASEPLAHLLRTTGRATLLGERTAGAMLSAPPRPLVDGWVLVVPEADFYAADGTRLERSGVPPHIAVPGDRAVNAVAERLRPRIPYAAALLDGFGHLEEARWEAAAQAFATAQSLAPDSLAPALGLGRAHVELRRWDPAFTAFESLLARRPDDMSALYQFGRLAALSGQRLAEGEVALRRYLQHEPEPGQPSHAAAYWRLGMILEAAGRTDEARAAYRAAVERDPANSTYVSALRRLAR